jgi:hypothetical protein
VYTSRSPQIFVSQRLIWRIMRQMRRDTKTQPQSFGYNAIQIRQFLQLRPTRSSLPLSGKWGIAPFSSCWESLGWRGCGRSRRISPVRCFHRSAEDGKGFLLEWFEVCFFGGRQGAVHDAVEDCGVVVVCWLCCLRGSVEYRLYS